MIPESKLIFKSGNRLNVKSIIYKKKKQESGYYRNMDQPGAINKKFKKNYGNQIFYTHKTFIYFRTFYILRTNLLN